MTRIKVTATPAIEFSVFGDTSTKSELLKSANGLIMNRLNEVYTDPIDGTCRETFSNAFDAIMMSDNPRNGRINIITPSTEKPFFQISDNAEGMSLEVVNEIFVNYGGSLKRENLNAIGEYGMGSKAPLSYGDKEFSVVTIHEGKRISFSMYVSNGEIHASQRIVEDTDLASGTTITVPVSKAEHYQAFAAAAKENSQYSFEIPVYVNGDLVTNNYSKIAEVVLVPADPANPNSQDLMGDVYLNRSKSVKFGELFYKNDFENAFSYVLGGSKYPSSMNNSDDVLIVQIAPAIVRFNASRDAIIYDDRADALRKQIAHQFDMQSKTDYPEENDPTGMLKIFTKVYEDNIRDNYSQNLLKMALIHAANEINGANINKWHFDAVDFEGMRSEHTNNESVKDIVKLASGSGAFISMDKDAKIAEFRTGISKDSRYASTYRDTYDSLLANPTSLSLKEFTRTESKVVLLDSSLGMKGVINFIRKYRASTIDKHIRQWRYELSILLTDDAVRTAKILELFEVKIYDVSALEGKNAKKQNNCSVRYVTLEDNLATPDSKELDPRRIRIWTNPANETPDEINEKSKMIVIGDHSGSEESAIRDMIVHGEIFAGDVVSFVLKPTATDLKQLEIDKIRFARDFVPKSKFAETVYKTELIRSLSLTAYQVSQRDHAHIMQAVYPSTLASMAYGNITKVAKKISFSDQDLETIKNYFDLRAEQSSQLDFSIYSYEIDSDYIPQQVRDYASDTTTVLRSLDSMYRWDSYSSLEYLEKLKSFMTDSESQESISKLTTKAEGKIRNEVMDLVQKLESLYESSLIEE